MTRPSPEECQPCPECENGLVTTSEHGVTWDEICAKCDGSGTLARLRHDQEGGRREQRKTMG